MHFPVYLYVAHWKIPSHPIFESLAYFVGFRTYLVLRKRSGEKPMPPDIALWILVGAVLGAAIGSKLLSWLEDPWVLLQHINDPHYYLGGKTIVGGLLGGLIGVEWVKKRIGWHRSTGDAMVWPLIIGMCIGRVGCFLAGLPDYTYGTPTHWITGVDFGDGVPRHPTQLYEIAFLLALGLFIAWVTRRHRSAAGQPGDGLHRSPAGQPADGRLQLPEGARFQMFMVGYLAFRLCVEFIKPTPHPYFGLSNIQWASIAGILYYIPRFRALVPSTARRETEVEHAK